jgi:hypothetical protein
MFLAVWAIRMPVETAADLGSIGTALSSIGDFAIAHVLISLLGRFSGEMYTDGTSVSDRGCHVTRHNLMQCFPAPGFWECPVSRRANSFQDFSPICSKNPGKCADR